MRHAASTASWRVKSVASPIQRVAEEALIGLHRGASFVVNEELDTRPDHRRTGFLRARAERDRHIFGTEAEAKIVSRPRHGPIENRPGWTAQRDTNFGRRHRQPLADANLKRHTLPPPRIDRESHRGEGLDVGVRGDAGLTPVACILAAHERAPGQRTNRAQHLDALIAELENARRRRAAPSRDWRATCNMWFCTTSRSAPNSS